MDPQFWRQRWADGRIGFHRSEVNPRLRLYLERLDLHPGDRVFVPLCGKAVDMPWLAAQGYTAVGVELSELAVAALFRDHDVPAERTQTAALERWQGGGMIVYRGDYFALTPEQVGSVAAVWDRAALIALPAELRPAYVEHGAYLLPPGAHVLLVTMAYDDAGVAGPPFAVPPSEVEAAYGPWFTVECLEREVPADVPGDLAERGVTEVFESVWLLTRNEQPATPQPSLEETDR